MKSVRFMLCALSFGSKLRYHGLIFEIRGYFLFYFFSVCLKKRGAWEERLCWRSRKFFMSLGEIGFLPLFFILFEENR